MPNLDHILESAGTMRPGEGAIATLVKISGSSYRKSGARLFIRPDGTTVGSISGGCLEHDVAEKALSVMQGLRPVVAVFDMTGTNDELWGYGQGCNGVLSILIEPVTPETTLPFDLLRSVVQARKPAIIATVLFVQGELKVQTGSRVLVYPDGRVRETIRNPFVTAALVQEARNSLERESRTVMLAFTEGTAEVFLEVIQPPVALVIAGAGADALPLARFAKELGWHVTILDHREALVTRDRFPLADSLVVLPPERLNGGLTADVRSAAVIMTHQARIDLALLPAFLRGGYPYVGVLGAKGRMKTILLELERTGVHLKHEELSRVYSPVGLNIGAESPEEIALAIIAEIQAVMHDRPSGFLRDNMP